MAARSSRHNTASQSSHHNQYGECESDLVPILVFVWCNSDADEGYQLSTTSTINQVGSSSWNKVMLSFWFCNLRSLMMIIRVVFQIVFDTGGFVVYLLCVDLALMATIWLTEMRNERNYWYFGWPRLTFSVSSSGAWLFLGVIVYRMALEIKGALSFLYVNSSRLGCSVIVCFKVLFSDFFSFSSFQFVYRHWNDMRSVSIFDWSHFCAEAHGWRSKFCLQILGYGTSWDGGGWRDM